MPDFDKIRETYEALTRYRDDELRYSTESAKYADKAKRSRELVAQAEISMCKHITELQADLDAGRLSDKECQELLWIGHDIASLKVPVMGQPEPESPISTINCPVCAGVGLTHGLRCPNCRGHGKLPVKAKLRHVINCPDCDGTGNGETDPDDPSDCLACIRCGGTGAIC